MGDGRSSTAPDRRIVGCDGGQFRTQAEADALFAEALADHPLRPGLSQRQNVVTALLSVLNCRGSLALPRGWVRSLQLAFRDAGMTVPTAGALRSYRSKLVDCPEAFGFNVVPGLRDAYGDLVDGAQERASAAAPGS